MSEDTKSLIKLVCLPIKDLSRDLGVPYDTVRSWSSGRIDPSPENRAALLKFMGEHAKKLRATVDELEA